MLYICQRQYGGLDVSINKGILSKVLKKKKKKTTI
jgi:hypothetical protein